MREILVYEIKDNGCLSHTVASLDDIPDTIKGWMEEYANQDAVEEAQLRFTITPTWITEEEYNNLKN